MKPVTFKILNVVREKARSNLILQVSYWQVNSKVYFGTQSILRSHGTAPLDFITEALKETK